MASRLAKHNRRIKKRRKREQRAYSGEVICPYCSGRAELIEASEIHPGIEKLAGEKLWRCDPCDAHVGCHRGTSAPLGTLADSHLRVARRRAHVIFDAIWQSSGTPSRNRAYAWLADRLRIPGRTCHIGQFDLEQCRRTIEVAQDLRKFLGMADRRNNRNKGDGSGQDFAGIARGTGEDHRQAGCGNLTAP